MKYDPQTDSYSGDPYITPAPPETSETWRTTRWIFWAFLILLGFVTGRVSSSGAAADQPLCIAVNNAQWPASIEGVDWVGYPQKWEGVPLSTFDQEPLLLPLGEWSEGAYALYRLDDSILIIPMYTLLDNTPDMHTVCPDVVRWHP